MMKNKKIFSNSLLLFISLYCMQGFSQQTATAPSFTFPPIPSPLLQEYKARDYVKLQAGFSYTATAANPFKAWIDETQIFPVVTTTTPLTDNSTDIAIDYSLPVAAIPGSASVSNSGAANYNIPILVPPGTKGMVPNLSIAYSSQGGSGILGLGWNITGLSAITRIPQTYYINGDPTAVDLSANDRFALDGNRLVLETGTSYGADGAEYRTENESFSKIISHGTAGTGPAWVEVKTIDGTIIEYGNAPDSKFIPQGTASILIWKINKITDRFGNYMVFHYRTVDNENVIESIEYTGNAAANVTPYNKIQFVYEEKTDKSFAYVAGIKLNQKLLLAKIKIFAEGQIRDEYTFDFYYDANLNATKLQKVKQKINDQTDINATKVIWENSASNFAQQNFTSIPYSTGCTERKTATGDFDGDGIDEILMIEGSNQTSMSYTWIGKFWKMYKYESGNLVLKNSGTWTGTPYTYNNYGSNYNIQAQQIIGDIEVVDMNSDGKDEFYIQSMLVSNTFYVKSYHLYKYNNSQTISLVNNDYITVGYSTGSGYNFISTGYYDTYYYDPMNIASASNNKIFDYNGDGKPDFLCLELAEPEVSNMTGRNRIYVYLQNETGFIKTRFAIMVPYGMLSSINLVDFKGNGKSNIMVISDSYTDWFYNEIKNCAIYEYKTPPSADLTVYDYAIIYNEDYPTKDTKFYLGDFNGDGKTDVMSWEASTNSWTVSHSNGSLFESGVATTIKPFDNTTENHNYVVLDFDHDGKDDFLDTWNIKYRDTTIRVPRIVWNDWQGRYDTVYDNVNTRIYLDSLPSTIDLYLSKSNDFNKLTYINPTNGLSLNWNTDASGLWYNLPFFNNRYAPLYGDFTGTDKTSIFGWSRLSNTPAILFFRMNDKSNFVKSIYDGFNNKHEFIYQTLTSGIPSLYTKGTTATYPVIDVQLPFYIVYQHKFINVSDPTHPITEEYRYEGLRINMLSNSLLGFSSTSTINNTLGGFTKYFYENKGVFNKQMTTKTESYALNNTNWQLISDVSYTNEVKNYPLSTTPIEQRRCYYYQSKATAKDYLNDVKKESGYIDVNYPNPSLGNDDVMDRVVERTYNSIAATSAFEEVIKDITYRPAPAYAPWYASQPSSEIVTRKLTGATPDYVRTKNYEYTNENLSAEKMDIANNDFNVWVEYLNYSSFGIPLTIKTHPPTNNPPTGISADNTLATITETTTYDSKGRFVIEQKNTANHITTFEYEPKYGNVTKTIDPNLFETKFEYDNVGRKIKTIFHDNTEESIAYSWACGGSYPSNSLFKTVVSSSDNPNITTLYDALSRAIRSETTNFNGETVFSETVYNTKGQIEEVSLPYVDASLKKYTNYTYDYLGRKTSETQPDNSFTNIAYQPRITTLTTGGTGVASQTQTTEVNCLRQVTFVKDNNNKKVNYKYNSAGLLIETGMEGTVQTTMTYNLQGKRILINDPDAGLTTTIYDAYGQLVKQTDARGKVTEVYYNTLGQITAKTQTEGTTTYEYYTEVPNLSKLRSVTGWSGITNSYSYDALGREIEASENIDSKSLKLHKTYDIYGKLTRLTYLNNDVTDLVLKYTYQNGLLHEVKKIDEASSVTPGEETAEAMETEVPVEPITTETIIWHGARQDLFGNYDIYNSGTLSLPTYKTYDANTGRLASIKTGFPTQSGNNFDIQNLDYLYDAIGNITSRKETCLSCFSPESESASTPFQQENFTYDALNRLQTVSYSSDIVTTPVTKTMLYDNTGNITQMPGIGVYTYGTNAGPHAITKITPLAGGNPVPINTIQDVTYTSFNKVLKITENGGTDVLDFIYGPDYSRRKTIHTSANGTSTKYFAFDSYEEETKVNNGVTTTTKDYYIYGGDGLAAIYRINGTSSAMYYVHKDHLGSFHKITNESGATVDSYSFDAWGNRRNAFNWTQSDNAIHLFSRGYTGHEHLDKFGIINMNGRLYDPLLGRFLSPDPLVQAPNFTQSFNRYSYCLNNPLIYTDPSGYAYYGYKQAQEKFAEYINGINNQLQWDNYNWFKGLDRFRDQWKWGETEGGGWFVRTISADGSEYKHTLYDGLISDKITNTAGMVHIINTFSHELNNANIDNGNTMLPEVTIIGFDGTPGSGRLKDGVPSWWGNYGDTKNGKNNDFLRIPNPIILADGRKVGVTFLYTSKDGRNGNQKVRERTFSVLKSALLKCPKITSIDVSASTNGFHKDRRHKEGLALDIDMFNGIPVRSMQDDQIIIDFQKALETNTYLYQDFGPSYNFYPGHQNHVHFSINRY